MNQALQLSHVGQSPVSLIAASIAGIAAVVAIHRAVGIELGHVRESGGPVSFCASAVGVC